MKRHSDQEETPSKKPKLLSSQEIQKRLDAARSALSSQPTLEQPSTDNTGKGGIHVGIHPMLMANTKEIPIVQPSNFATLKSNQRVMDHKIRVALSALKKPVLKIEKVSADFSDPSKNPYYDPKLQSASSAPKEKFSRSLKFAPKGKYIEQANQIRADEHLEKLKEQIAATVRKAGMEKEMDLVADDSLRRELPPPIEWWDEQLVHGDYDAPLDDQIQTPEGECLISNLVQHPIPILPPDADKIPPPKVMLTEKERKKLRRQRRLEALKEKQDKIKLGILPPEQPKVKIANLMRVMGMEAVQDPTKVEAMVRKQMDERQLKHEEHNQGNKLTDEQRKEKKAARLEEDTTDGVHIAVFRYVFRMLTRRVKMLNHPHFRFKVDRNAKQHNLSGTAILYPSFNIVIVEGGPKGIRFFKNLMLNRIEWTKFDEKDEPNECVLVWEGQLARGSFKGFRFKTIPTEMMAKDFLQNHGVVHYWNAAKNYVPEGM